MKIEFARGDNYDRGFLIKDRSTGQTVTEPYDEIYFTVKRNAVEHDFLFQKRLSTGGIVSDGEGHYTLHISPEDTNNLSFGEYDCDIEVMKNGSKKTFYGQLKLCREVTHQYNE